MKVLVCICLFLAVAHGRSYKGDKVFHVTVNELEQLEKLENLVEDYELDYWKRPRNLGDSADIRVPFQHLSQFLVYLKANRLNSEVFIEDVQKLIDEESRPHPVPRDLASFDYEVYHDFDEIQQWVKDFAAEYPSLASRQVVGKSYEGREFSALTVSSGAGRRQFVINCGIHAREWISPATCMFSANFLVSGYQQQDPSITAVLDKVDFVFIPSSNPDGYTYSWTNDRMWRKTRTPNSPSRCVGADPNRNWEANHCGSGASTSPCSDTYCGSAPFSEPSTLAQKNFVEALPNVKMYVDVHSYSQLWLYPYAYTTSRPADFNTLDKIAVDSVAAIRATHGKIYEPGQSSTTIYVASGTTADYFYDASGIKCSFVPELRDTGRYGFLLPEDQIKPTAEESFNAFMVMGQAVANGECD